MSTPGAAVSTADEQRPLSEVERLVDVFIAPTKTFNDIKRNANWLWPFVLLIVLSLGYSYSIGKKVTWEQAAENQKKLMTQTQLDRMEQQVEQASDKQDMRRRQQTMMVGITKGIGYTFPVIALFMTAVFAAIYLLTMNFGLGAQLSFKHVFAVMMYANVVRGVWTLLAIIGIYTFIDPQDFQISMPLATNPAAFISPTEHPFLFGLLSQFDIFALWGTALTGLGFSVLSKKSLGVCMGVAFGVLIAIALVFSLPKLL